VTVPDLKMSFSSERRRRIERLRDWLSGRELDAAVFLKEDIELNNYNYVYYGGNLASEEYSALIVDASGNTSAVVQEHAFERVKSSHEFLKVVGTRQSTDQLISNLNALTKSYRHGAVHVDSASLTTHALKKIERIGIIRDDALTEFAYAERSRKSAYEIGQIEKAVRIGAKALRRTIDSLKVGSKVEGIAVALKKEMLDGGAVSESFSTDVKIRRGVTEKEAHRLERGSLLLFDFGARLESQYVSDMGTTIPYGANHQLRDFMNEVYEIKKTGLRKIRAGRTGNEVRKEIDELIQEYDYASVHRPGHQIGLNVHEPYEPNLAYGEENNKPLHQGNVVTWEPGIGLRKPKLATVRFGLAHMEDMVLVRGDSKMIGNVPLEFQ
jgi:Xaa-Pro aminopeptidase